MSDTPAPEPFELFPRRRLRFDTTRRQFFDQLRLEVAVAEGLQNDGAAYNLSRLGLLPDEQLAWLRPRVLPGARISVEGDMVYGCPPGGPASRPLFTVHPATTTAFNGMDGGHTLAEIAARLAAHTGWEQPQAFAFARGLFLYLVEQRVGAPA